MFRWLEYFSLKIYTQEFEIKLIYALLWLITNTFDEHYLAFAVVAIKVWHAFNVRSMVFIEVPTYDEDLHCDDATAITSIPYGITWNIISMVNFYIFVLRAFLIRVNPKISSMNTICYFQVNWKYFIRSITVSNKDRNMADLYKRSPTKPLQIVFIGYI